VKGAALSAIHNLLLLSAHPFALGSYDDFAYVEGDCPKLDATLQELKRIREQGEKAIVFTRFLRVQSILQAAIRQELNVWPDIVNGAINTNRQRIVDVFSAKPGFDVLILSHDVGGVGLNITAANHVIHYTRPWNPAKENQATDRAHRIGQDREVTVYYPVAVGNGFESVEERLGRLLSAKSALARDVLRPSRDMEVRAEEMFSCVEDVPAGGDEAPESTRDAE
jgi:SNF2 family DNA or RNA helicase